MSVQYTFRVFVSVTLYYSFESTRGLSLSLQRCHCCCCFFFLVRSTYQMVRLQNPTDELLVLTPHCSNTRNFNIELDSSKQILLPASSMLEVPLKFTPSAIGHLHSAEISFNCPQVSEDRELKHETSLQGQYLKTVFSSF